MRCERKKMAKNLRISKKSSTFASEIEGVAEASSRAMLVVCPQSVFPIADCLYMVLHIYGCVRLFCCRMVAHGRESVSR